MQTDGLQAVEKTDPMVNMDDVISRFKVPKIGNKKVPLGCLGLFGSKPNVSFIEEIVASQDTEIDCRKIIAGVEISDFQENAAIRSARPRLATMKAMLSPESRNFCRSPINSRMLP